MTEIILKNIYKSYDQTEVIHGVDLKLESGKFLVLVGPSGCGKSTLLRIIAGLEKVTSGNILIDGEHVNNVPAAERGLAMVFQSYALYPHMSVYKNMAFGLENLKISKVKILDKKHISNLFTSKNGFSIQGISFNSINESIGKYLLNYKKEISVIGYLNNNFWNNKKILQLVVRDIII